MSYGSGALVLLGAGASHGSDDLQYVPPIGDALFAELCRFSPQSWGAIPAAPAALFNGDFERGMSALAEAHPHALPPLQRAMAAYFFEFRPRFAGLYFQLASRLKAAGWQGAVASLNYECMLPMALDSAGVRVTCGGSPSSGVELCLPHGMCNLFVDGVTVNPQLASMHGTFAKIGYGMPVRAIYDAIEFRAQILGNGVPPIMSYFEPQKTTMAGGHFIERQRARFDALAQAAELIVIVGVRVRERDVHIWQPIASSLARVLYCSGSAGAEFSAWASGVRIGKQSIDLGGLFRDRFNEFCAELGV